MISDCIYYYIIMYSESSRAAEAALLFARRKIRCHCERQNRCCHCEPVVLRAANQNLNDCRWQSYLSVAHAGVVPAGDSLRSQSPGHSECPRISHVIANHPAGWCGNPYPCLLLRGVVLRAANQNYNDCRWQSYHNVQVPGGRMRSLHVFALIRLALAGDARATFPQGKAGVRIATPV